MELKKYKVAAGLGTILMGLGAFMACLSEVSAVANSGNVLLIVSMIIMGYGYSKWQP